MSRPVRRDNPFRRLGELFDASALGLVTLLLLAASFYATWQGMSDFVTSKGTQSETGTAGLVLLVVLTLTLAMYVALRETVNPIRWRNIFIAFPLYALLAIWSVGFGYGFWWSLIAGEDATEAALTRTLDSVVEAGIELKAEIGVAVALVDAAEASSEARAERERTVGGTCGEGSPAGNGPRSRARETSRSHIADIGKMARESWLPETTQALDEFATPDWTATIEGETPEARKRRLVEAGRKANRLAKELSAESGLYGGVIAGRLGDVADFLSVAPASGEADFCYDRDLAEQLRSVSNALDRSYEIEPVPFRFAEGADGVAQAVEDLWLGLFARTGLVEREAGAGFRPKEQGLVALWLAMGIDAALFVFALLRGGFRREYDGGLPPVPIEAETQAIETEAPAALPAPEEESEVSVVKDAEFVEKPQKPKRRVETEPRNMGIPTSAADSFDQRSLEEKVEKLLANVEMHLGEIHSAGSAVSRAAAQMRFDDAVRRLSDFGYEKAGMKDEIVNDCLHEVDGEEESDLPVGRIVRIIRPRFMQKGEREIIRALVIVSKGRE
ncbi:MAG: hypothetical protein ABJG15_05880 [Hyphomonadaceae bacterium]